ncbi:hypothetical protein FZZ90_04010 [Synechococcus sp. MU1617]|nr:hypothetical protein [Synechococcus sp. MU1617]
MRGSNRWFYPVVGLYDTTGMLRFAGSSVEACMEYATLFQIPVGPTSLQSLPEPVSSTIRLRGDRILEGRNS